MRAAAGDVIIALAYAVAAWTTLLRVGPSRAPTSPAPHGARWSTRSYWQMTGVALAVMAVGRAGSAERAREIVRDSIQDRAWYAQRTVPQIAAIAIAAVVIIGSVELARRRLDAHPPLAHPAAFGVLVVLAAVRMISLHHVERVLLVEPFGTVTIAHATELGLLAVVVISAARG